MQTIEGAKRDLIIKLQVYLNDLQKKDNGYNSHKIEYIYSYVYDVIYAMEGMTAFEALDYYEHSTQRNNIFRHFRR